MGSTYQVFLKYVSDYTKFLTFYKNIVENIVSEINRRKNKKRSLQLILTNYFAGYADLNKEFSEKNNRLPNFDRGTLTNEFGNIKADLHKQTEELFFLRNNIAKEYQKISTFVSNTVLKKIQDAFSRYN